jgi:hypothetical protein
MFALRRTFPQIYQTNDRLQIDVSKIIVQDQDFRRAMKKMVPTAQRSNSSSGRMLNSTIKPLLQSTLDRIYSDAVAMLPAVCGVSSLLATGSAIEDVFAMCDPLSEPFNVQPRMLLCGKHGQGQVQHLGPALVHMLEGLPCHTLDMATLHGVGMRTPEEACVQIIQEAQRTAPSVLFVPDVQSVWSSTQNAFHSIFLSLINAIPSSTTIVLVATAECPFSSLPDELQGPFSRITSNIYEVDTPNEISRRSFLEDLFLDYPLRLPPKPIRAVDMPSLPLAPPPPPRQLSTTEVSRLEERRDETLRELRIFLRDCTNKLIADRKFKVFTKPVDPEEAPDYYQVVTNPMDLSIIMNKIDRCEYRTVKHWLADIDLITTNCVEYNPDSQTQGKLLRHRAWGLKDFAHALITREMDSDFEELCQELEDNYQEFHERNNPNSKPKTGTLSSLLTHNNPAPANDSQQSRKSLRVRGIRAETPPPLSDMKKSRQYDYMSDISPQKQSDRACSSQDLMSYEQETISSEENDDTRNSSDQEELESNEESLCQYRDVLEACETPDAMISKRTNRLRVINVKPTSIDTSEMEECQTVDVQTVQVDQTALQKLLTMAVNATSKATVAELEGLYSQLSKSIYSHRMELEKSSLLQDMNDCIQRYLSKEIK